ncbi:MAG: LysR substrate-binding domain-containing protein [Polyangiales bacterium]
MDRFEAFATFAAVADTGGFAAGARRLGRSAAAVTRTVAALETELGTQLFRRTTRVVNLTDAGARFLVDVKRILADVEESSSAVAGAHAEVRGPLVVTASVMFGEMYVAPVLLAFMRKHTEVSPRALLVDRVVDLLDEGVDVAIRIAHLRDSSLRAVRVGEVRRVLCASPGYLEAHGRPKKPADLRQHATIAFASGAPPRDWSFPRDRRAQRVAIEPRLVTNNTATSLAAARAGQGIARALSYQVADDVRAGRLVVILREFEPPPLPIHVVHTGGASAPARVRSFVDFAVERLRADVRLDPRLRKSQPR